MRRRCASHDRRQTAFAAKRGDSRGARTAAWPSRLRRCGAGRIDAPAYLDLLARLYGFHQLFEAEFVKAPPVLADAINLANRRRSELIAGDLGALGIAGGVADLSLCPTLPRCLTEPQWLGALYVTEGPTLGGAQIARALARAGFAREQRQFCEAYGERRGWMWRTFLDRLEAHADDSEAAVQAENSAQTTFDVFEAWMLNWQGAADFTLSSTAV